MESGDEAKQEKEEKPHYKRIIEESVEETLYTTKKESTSKGHMPSQKFKYRRKRLLARAYDPRKLSYLLLLLKEILRPYLHK